MNNYFRATIYDPKNDICAIIDAHNYLKSIDLYEYQLKYYGFQIINITDKIGETNIRPTEEDTKHLILRACDKGTTAIQNNKIEIKGKYYYIGELN